MRKHNEDYFFVLSLMLV